MDYCAYHKDFVAIENCETCDRPLCSLCLWYTADGHRLCEEHAKERQNLGEQVYSPAVYAEAVQNTLELRSQSPDEDDATYGANKQDVNALVSAIIAATALFSCCGGVYCLPVVALLLGAVAYFSADKAIDPARTRRMAGFGIGIGGLMLAIVVAFLGLYAALIVIAVVSSSRP